MPSVRPNFFWSSKYFLAIQNNFGRPIFFLTGKIWFLPGKLFSPSKYFWSSKIFWPSKKEILAVQNQIWTSKNFGWPKKFGRSKKNLDGQKNLDVQKNFGRPKKIGYAYSYLSNKRAYLITNFLDFSAWSPLLPTTWNGK